MSDPRFNIVFSGDLAKGADPAATRKNFAKLFKLPEAKIEGMFSGRAIVLKKNVDIDTAGKYRVALKKAGALVSIQEIKAVPKAKVTGRASFGAGAEVASLTDEARQKDDNGSVDKAHPSEPQSGAVESSSEVKVPELARSAKDLALMPSGAPVLNASERVEHPPANIDVSAYSMREVGEDLVESGELAKEDAVVVDDLATDIAEAGSDLLPDLKETASIVDSMDLSHLTMAERGEDLGQAKTDMDQIKRDFDLSHLSLVADTVEDKPEDS